MCYCWRIQIYHGNNRLQFQELFEFLRISPNREIDEAFLRRFERKILIDLPNDENRTKIINQFLPNTKLWGVNKIEQLIESSGGFTGADLKIACKEASMKQIRKKLKSNKHSANDVFDVTFDDLIESIKQIKPSMTASAAKHRQWQSKYGNQII